MDNCFDLSNLNKNIDIIFFNNYDMTVKYYKKKNI